MSLITWKLVDVEREVYVSDWHVGRRDVAEDAGDFSLCKRTLRGGLRDGLSTMEIDNGALRIVVLPDRGMGLWRIWQGELELGWPSPVKGPVNPPYVPVAEPTGIGWLTGFDELLCRCGLEYNGPPEWGGDGRLKHTLHGRIANLPAHRLEATFDPAHGELAVQGVVDEARLFGNNLRLTSTVSTRLGEPRLKVVDEVTNISARPADLELLYHINLGPPLAAPGSKFFAPIAVMAPRDAAGAADVPTWQAYPPEQPGASEIVLYFELAAGADGRTGVLLCDAGEKRGISVSFNRRQFPYFTLWKNPQAVRDGYCTGLEPCINFPNVKSFEKEQGRVAVLAPDETRRFELELEVFDHGGINRARQTIAERQRGTEAKILDRPCSGWSPAG